MVRRVKEGQLLRGEGVQGNYTEGWRREPLRGEGCRVITEGWKRGTAERCGGAEGGGATIENRGGGVVKAQMVLHR